MVTFNRLNADPDITGSDQVPVYDSGSNRLRKGTMTQVAEFVRTSLGLDNELVEEAPNDGFTYGRQNKSWITINKDDAGRVVPLIAPRQTGDGVKLEFDSPIDYAADPRGFFVEVDGITQRPLTDYTIDANGKVVFVGTPPSGALIDIRFFQPSTGTEVVSDAQWFDTVSDMIVGGGSLGTTAITRGYYAAGDGGGAQYLITAGNSGDGLISHNISGNTAVLQHNGKIYAEQAGARKNTDDNSFSDALQAIALYTKRANDSGGDFPIVATAGSGRFYMTKPVYIDAFDGLEFNFNGRLKTQIVVSASFANTTVPSWFGAPSPSTYLVDALFIVARGRITNLADGYLPPDYAPRYDTAAGTYKWSEFTVLCGNKRKLVDVIYAPEISGSVFENISCDQVRRFLTTTDVGGSYLCRFNKLSILDSVEPVYIQRGTSLEFNDCSATNCNSGWHINVFYSSMTNCTVDHWGIGNWAYEISGTGNTLTSCGCEYGSGGTLRVYGDDSEVAFTGCFFLGGALEGDTNWTSQANESDFGVANLIEIDAAQVTFVRTTFRNACEPTSGNIVQLDAVIRNTGNVVLTDMSATTSARYMQRSQWVTEGGSALRPSSLSVSGEKAVFRCSSDADYLLYDSSSSAIDVHLPVSTPAHRDGFYDYGFAYFNTNLGIWPKSGNVTGYRAPYEGLYQITFVGYIENAQTGDFIYVDGSGEPNYVIAPRDTDGLISFSDVIYLDAGEEVTLRYRHYGTTATLKSGAIFSGHSI